MHFPAVLELAILIAFIAAAWVLVARSEVLEQLEEEPSIDVSTAATTDRETGFSGNAHDRRLARRQQARAAMLPNA